jgi:hypothetical protein
LSVRVASKPEHYSASLPSPVPSKRTESSLNLAAGRWVTFHRMAGGN